MAKLFYMQFYPLDYQADVRCLPMATQGAWMQILCVLWRSSQRGKRTLTLEEWARELGCTSSELSLYLMQLEYHKVGKISRECIENVERITISSKRIAREKMKQSLALKRKQKQRVTSMSRACHADVTLMSRQCHAEELELESELKLVKKEKKEKKEKIKDCEGVDSAGPTVPAVVTPAQRVWARYREEYVRRYHAEPVRNATVNGQIAQLVKRIGAESAPEVAAFYVWHNDQFYVRNQHPIGLLLKSCEGLHTQWVKGQTVTGSQARKIDETQGRVNVFQELIDEQKGGVIDA